MMLARRSQSVTATHKADAELAALGAAVAAKICLAVSFSPAGGGTGSGPTSLSIPPPFLVPKLW